MMVVLGERIGVERRVTSVYLDPLIWKDFLDTCKRQGLTTCSVLEAFMYGFNKGTSGLGPSSPLPAVNVTLNVTQTRAHYRRLSHDAGVAPSYQVDGSPSKCSSCDGVPVKLVRYGRGLVTQFLAYRCEICFKKDRATKNVIGWRDL